MIYVKTKLRRRGPPRYWYQGVVHVGKPVGTGLDLACGHMLTAIKAGEWRDVTMPKTVYVMCDGPTTCKNCLKNTAVRGERDRAQEKNPESARKISERCFTRTLDRDYLQRQAGGLGFGAGVREQNLNQTEPPKAEAERVRRKTPRDRSFRLKTNCSLITEPFGSDLELSLLCLLAWAILANFGAAARSYFKFWRLA